MRILVVFFCLLFSNKSYCQVNAPKEDTTVKFRNIEVVSTFIDSISQKILFDTSKFKREDIAITKNGRVNKNSYSPLFYINFRYEYKLDIIEGKDVLLFLKEILISDNIKKITVIKDSQSPDSIGVFGKEGVVFIDLKDNVNPNFNIAGFKLKGQVGDNFR